MDPVMARFEEMINFPVCLGQRPFYSATAYLYPVPSDTDWKSDYGLLIVVLPSGESSESILSPDEFQDLLSLDWQ